MRKTTNGMLTLLTGAALALTLASCSNAEPTATAADNGSVEAAAQEAGSAAAEEGSLAEEFGLTVVWFGVPDDDTMVYYYEGADMGTGAILVYHVADNSFERWVGPMGETDDGKQMIIDAEIGDVVAYTVTHTGEGDIIELTTDDGLTAALSPDSIDDLAGTLDEVSAYATRTNG